MSGGAPGPTAVEATAQEAAVGAVLDNLQTFVHRWWAPVLLGVIMLFDSWDAVAVAYAMPTMSSEWNLNPLLMGFIISAGYAGQFIGAVTIGAVAERFGRMPVLNIMIVLMGALAVGTAFAPDYHSMLVIRFVQGIAIGGALPVSVTYINELAPTKIRGNYFALYQVLCMSGYACAAVSSTWIVPHLGWRWLMGLGAVPLILLPLAWITLPESPRWLARKGYLERANKALRKLGGAPAVFPEIVAKKVDAAVPAEPKPNTLTLFSKTYSSRTLTVTMLWALSLFANFGLTTWAPSIYVKVYHIPLERALQYGATANILFLICSPIAGFFIDKFGRRPLAIAGTFIAGAALISLAIFQPTAEIPVASLVITGAVAISVTVLILWPVTAETFPTSLRALGMGYASAIGRGSSMITPVFVGFVLNKGAPIQIVFAIFGIFCLLAFLVWVFRVRETAGKPLDTV